MDLDSLYVATGIARSTLSRFERDERLPNVDQCNAIADALHLNRHRFLTARINAGLPDGFTVIDEHGHTFPVQSSKSFKRYL